MSSAWPQFEVFIRSQQALQHKHASSLHASDIEHALLLARDVYTRRQEGISLWVLPSAAIIQDPQQAQASRTPAGLYEVFVQLKPGLDALHVASLQAQEASAALAQAQQTFGPLPLGALWLVPSSHIHSHAPADEAAFFTPSQSKLYRWPTFFQLPDSVDYM